jgi:hypothetical protein
MKLGHDFALYPIRPDAPGFSLGCRKNPHRSRRLFSSLFPPPQLESWGMKLGHGFALSRSGPMPQASAWGAVKTRIIAAPLLVC